jgi:predicted dehydrogenase
MVARLAEHERVRAVAAWDPSAAGVEAARAAGLVLARSAEELIGVPGVDCIYIASPPIAHMELANRAFDAGLPVFCEKPLAVDSGSARRTIARIAKERLRGAVNFSLASSPGLAAAQSSTTRDAVGRLQEVVIEVSFRAWPRPWQAEAGTWLAERREGGFTREVLSHFVFVLQRILGKAAVERSLVGYSGNPKDESLVGSEVSLDASLRAGGVPVRVNGVVGGDLDDFNRFALVGERGSVEFREWLTSRRMPGASAFESTSGGARPAYLRQLDELAAFIEGKPNLLPDFAEALAVQDTIEAMLAGVR